MSSSLKAEIDRALVDGLDNGIKNAVAELIRMGLSTEQIVAYMKRRNPAMMLTTTAIEVYAEQLQAKPGANGEADINF